MGRYPALRQALPSAGYYSKSFVLHISLKTQGGLVKWGGYFQHHPVFSCRSQGTQRQRSHSQVSERRGPKPRSCLQRLDSWPEVCSLFSGRQCKLDLVFIYTYILHFLFFSFGKSHGNTQMVVHFQITRVPVRCRP